MNIVVLDIGGSALKVWRPLDADPTKVETGPDFTPHDLVRETSRILGNALPDRISIGIPGVVRWSVQQMNR
jgi:hypothetical protein